ncbi:MAG: FAD-dependent oxidoreductase [Verrucomicrobiia bacterium]|jgi:NADPH-dependent glutamate synthase beta subunit-like oxidoreductase/dihydroorotate dehydrogenase/Pyruvate/2-oxoacid:ferredoxin oxidoreductase delta subunit
MKRIDGFLTDAQFRAELSRCEYCEDKPCKEACPVDCSPADFIMAAKVGGRCDFQRAAALIMGNNPLGGVCGAVCPDRHCMRACVHRTFDSAVNIPAVQATIIERAKMLGAMPQFAKAAPNGKKVAIFGAGPAGLGAAALLAQKGYAVDLFDKAKQPGGMCNLIPKSRLSPEVLKTDIDFLMSLGKISVKKGRWSSAIRKGYDAILVATGLDEAFIPKVKNANAGPDWMKYLENPGRFRVKGKRVAIIGGGAVALDCAEEALTRGARSVEMFALETWSEMPLTAKERRAIEEAGIIVTGRVRVAEILKKGNRITGLSVVKVTLPRGKKFHPRNVVDLTGIEQALPGVDFVIVAAGARASDGKLSERGLFYAGDMVNGPTTVVEAVAAGKNAALDIDAFVYGRSSKRGRPDYDRATKSRTVLPGRVMLPVGLTTDFFGREIVSPFLLSAAPPSDGYNQMKKAYEAGWAGGVMKTSFDNVPIHIPSEYMFAFSRSTYANCDNVSGHSLSRVCREIERLRREYPDRLTAASTGGPVSGNDETDSVVWQSNTRKLEAAGAMGIEYSLSCPQGGDGTKGDIVSQDAELTAKIIGWVMETGDADVPKLFKLTAAVTSIYPIMSAIKEVFARYPGKKAGVTLANTFPTLAFRKGEKTSWDEGIVVGMSGEGVLPISNLTLANVSRLGVTVSGNGGPMDYKAAANFLALGARTVQFCTIVMKYGYGIIDELHSGLSCLMQERGIKSVGELIGSALPVPVTGFMELSPVKKISAVDAELCEHCGNCLRCPYLAITFDSDKVPVTDPTLCIGCSICVQKCFAGALYMRKRTKHELAILNEA